MSLERARRIKSSRARVLAQVASGALLPAEVVRNPPKALRGLDLYVLLMRCPYTGKEGARKVCESAHVWPHLTLGELTHTQRKLIIEHLPERI